MKKLFTMLFCAAIVLVHLLPVSAADSLDDGLIIHYTFDEGSGTSIKDSKGGNDLTLDNASRRVKGCIGSGAISFDGTDAQVLQTNMGINANLRKINTKGAFSISLWAKFDKDGTTDNTLVGWGATTDYTRIFVQTGSSNLGVQTKTGYPYAWNYSEDKWGTNAKNLLASEKWHNIIITYDSNVKQVGIYIDGIFYEGTAAPDAKWADSKFEIEPMTDWFTLGSMHDRTSANFKGEMDDVRVYDRVLSANDIDAIQSLPKHSGGNQSPPSPPTSDNKLIMLSVCVIAVTALPVIRKRRI